MEISLARPRPELQLAAGMTPARTPAGPGAKLPTRATEGIFLQIIEKNVNTSPNTPRCIVGLPLGRPLGIDKFTDSQRRTAIGVVSNLNHGSPTLNKAGRSQWLGRRPMVRDVAVNPVHRTAAARMYSKSYADQLRYGGPHLINIKWVTSSGFELQKRKMTLPVLELSGSESLMAHIDSIYSCDLRAELGVDDGYGGLMGAMDVNSKGQCRLQYMDDDGDWVTLETAQELDAAFATQKRRPFLLFVFLFDGITSLVEKGVLENSFPITI